MTITRHAERRARQRGVTDAAIHAVLAWGDVEIPARAGCVVLRLSQRRLADRDLRASLGPLADRIRSLALVVADDGGLVTVVHTREGARGRPYRRPA